MRTHESVPATTLDTPEISSPLHAGAMNVSDVHAAHGDFVWASLQRLGGRERDLEDLFQEVFVVVHQRLASFERRSSMTTWLFGICFRVAAAYRRRAHVRREVLDPSAIEDQVGASALDPEQAASAAQSRAVLQQILDDMDLDRRAVFVMAEVEELPCDEIAAMMGVPLGTVYSRLHAARKDFDGAVKRWRARATTGGER